MTLIRIAWLMILLVPWTALGSDLFQWTDSRGVIHFSDDFYSVPESIRQSSRLIVRRDFDLRKRPISASTNHGPEAFVPAPQPPQTHAYTPPVNDPSVLMTEPPQNVTIVVINSNVRQAKKHPCPSRETCKSGFRPDFNDRRYVHPSVFNGASQRYIHPR